MLWEWSHMALQLAMPLRAGGGHGLELIKDFSAVGEPLGGRLANFVESIAAAAALLLRQHDM